MLHVWGHSWSCLGGAVDSLGHAYENECCEGFQVPSGASAAFKRNNHRQLGWGSRQGEISAPRPSLKTLHVLEPRLSSDMWIFSLRNYYSLPSHGRNAIGTWFRSAGFHNSCGSRRHFVALSLQRVWSKCQAHLSALPVSQIVPVSAVGQSTSCLFSTGSVLFGFHASKHQRGQQTHKLFSCLSSSIGSL